MIGNGTDILGIIRGTYPALHTAVVHGNLDIVDLLLKEGVNVNTRDSSGQTVCSLTTENDSVDMVQRLLDAHCDLELPEERG